MRADSSILVTGASTGIGRYIAGTLAERGHTVFATARKDSDLDGLAAIDNVSPLRCDVTRPEEIHAAVNEIAETGRGLRALVNNAGIGSIGYPIGLGMVVLVGFSVGAYVTSISRYYLYGLMLAVAPLVGEWLWREDLATHHGYPIVFGAAAVIIFITGMARFTGIVRRYPLPPDTATV